MAWQDTANHISNGATPNVIVDEVVFSILGAVNQAHHQALAAQRQEINWVFTAFTKQNSLCSHAIQMHVIPGNDQPMQLPGRMLDPSSAMPAPHCDAIRQTEPSVTRLWVWNIKRSERIPLSVRLRPSISLSFIVTALLRKGPQQNNTNNLRNNNLRNDHLRNKCLRNGNLRTGHLRHKYLRHGNLRNGHLRNK